MGSAGHAFISHTKALSPGMQTRDGDFGAPPHPLRLLPGMQFRRRRSRPRRALVVTRVTDEIAQCRSLDAEQRRMTVPAERLLATDDAGAGRYYSFLGYAKRQSGYRTVARLVAVRDGKALLCLPEWHPQRPVWTFADLIPGDAQAGDWLSVVADLDGARAAHLRVRNLSVHEPPDELSSRALVEMPPDPARGQRAVAGPGCGDLVVCVDSQTAERLRRPARDRWDRSVYVVRNRRPACFDEGLDPADLPSDAGLWLVQDGRVRERYTVSASSPNPNGTVLFLAEQRTAAEAGVECRYFHGWRWRWWPLGE